MPELVTQGTHEHVEDEAFILVKAAPRANKTHGETVCIAAVDKSGDWRRLYPVSFRYMAEQQRFGRWDKIRYRWRRPRIAADRRAESRRIDDRSIEIVGSLPAKERHALVNRICVTSLVREMEAGRSLALLRSEIIDFRAKRRSALDLEKQRQTYANLQAQGDLLAAYKESIPREPSPFEFHYRFRDDDGEHDGTCQDWETEATFMRRVRELGEKGALDWMQNKFGVEYPKSGMALAMGTHRHHPRQWLINGVIRYDETGQPLLL